MTPTTTTASGAARRAGWLVVTAVACAVLAPPPAAGAAARAARPTGSTTITFDTDAEGNPVTAPCLFADTEPLRDLYASLGVHFSGADADTGGAVLDQCGAFGVDARSGSAFLAFNQDTYAETPETITFDRRTRCTRFFFAAGQGAGTVTATAFRKGKVVATTTVASEQGYVPVELVSNGGYDEVRIVVTDDLYFVVDDLTFSSGRGC